MLAQDATVAFNLAGLQVISITQIRNGYWPDHPNFDSVRNDNPWWEVVTNEGMVRIGWRKRVIEIDWSATKRRGIITTDDVTKEPHLVHAYDIGKAISYLRNLRSLPIQEIINVDDRIFLIHGQKDVRMTLDLVMSETGLTSTQKAVIDLTLSQVTGDERVTMRLVRNKDYYSLKIKTDKMYLDIQP